MRNIPGEYDSRTNDKDIPEATRKASDICADCRSGNCAACKRVGVCGCPQAYCQEPPPDSNDVLDSLDYDPPPESGDVFFTYKPRSP